MATARKTVAPRPTTRVSLGADEAPTKEDPRKEDKVNATVHKTFTLTLDDGSTVSYQSGFHKMPKAHADHWFAKSFGGVTYEE